MKSRYPLGSATEDPPPLREEQGLQRPIFCAVCEALIFFFGGGARALPWGVSAHSVYVSLFDVKHKYALGTFFWMSSKDTPGWSLSGRS